VRRSALPAAAVVLLLTAPSYALDLSVELRATGESVAGPIVFSSSDAPFATVSAATGDSYGGAGLSARVMARARAGPWSGEAHLLLGAERRSAGAPGAQSAAGGPYRVMDLAWRGDEGRTATSASFDRLSLAWEGPGARITAGRFATTWGEGWFFSPLDLFGAFPLTATDRSFKPGIDGASVTLPLHDFAEVAGVMVPRSQEGRRQSAAIRALFPVGKASVNLLGGAVAGDGITGLGVSTDLAGSRVYGELTRVDAAFYEGVFSQWLLGWERQTGPSTHLLVELFRNGWGSPDVEGYAVRLRVPRFLEGRTPTLGRYELAGEATFQLTPLLTGGAGGVVNLLDGSALAQLSFGYSLSDFVTLRGGAYRGVGEGPRGGAPRSEFGLLPARAYLELVASF
jgi:hypothetical protein